jgi:hypothetical protein
VQLPASAFAGTLPAHPPGEGCVAKQRQGHRPAPLGVRAPGDAVGIQVPMGRIGADRNHWQTVFDASAKPAIYRLYNGLPADSEDPGNSMIVEVDSAKRTIQVKAGTSVDVLGKKIRVKAGTGGNSPSVEGWYVYVS